MTTAPDTYSPITVVIVDDHEVVALGSTGTPDSYASGSDGPDTQADILLDGHAWRPIVADPRTGPPSAGEPGSRP